ncbi:MAG: D-aminoacyl-tRNA deacylase [Methylococcales bacterium]|nr:D-aminoacyl-tRNA deacylase [Methylococcales bacterium]
MISIIQRVTEASVSVNTRVIGSIPQGIMALMAVEKDDTEKEGIQMLARILNYRIFADQDEKMNRSLSDIKGGLLIVPQFTLAADTEKGNRPSFHRAASPEQGRLLFNYLQHHAKEIYPRVQFGEFGANMQVSLVNDGPVTFTLKTKRSK